MKEYEIAADAFAKANGDLIREFVSAVCRQGSSPPAKRSWWSASCALSANPLGRWPEDGLRTGVQPRGRFLRALYSLRTFFRAG